MWNGTRYRLPGLLLTVIIRLRLYPTLIYWAVLNLQTGSPHKPFVEKGALGQVKAKQNKQTKALHLVYACVIVCCLFACVLFT